jgi:hypothetical protein
MAQNRAEQGSILIFLLASVTLLAGAILALITVEMGRAGRARTEVERTRAFSLAESGVDQVRVLLAANAFPAGTTLDWSDDGVDNDGDGRADEGDESVTASAALWWSDGIDNDGDGLTDETDEGVARVTSTARIGTSTQTVTGWVRRISSVVPLEVPAVVNLLDPNADVTFKGSSFLVDGRDHELTGGFSRKPSVYGIAINGSKASVLSQLTKNQTGSIMGTGGKPSITTWTPSSPEWLQNVIDAMALQADVTFNNFNSSYTGTLGNALAGKYLVTYSRGNLKLGGGSTGAGVLCVDGDLEITGKWEFVGPVFVTGRVTVKGGGSGQRLKGVIYIGGDLTQTVLSGATIKGGIELVYCSSAVAGISLGDTRYDIVAVTEP